MGQTPGAVYRTAPPDDQPSWPPSPSNRALYVQLPLPLFEDAGPTATDGTEQDGEGGGGDTSP